MPNGANWCPNRLKAGRGKTQASIAVGEGRRREGEVDPRQPERREAPPGRRPPRTRPTAARSDSGLPARGGPPRRRRCRRRSSGRAKGVRRSRPPGPATGRRWPGPIPGRGCKRSDWLTTVATMTVKAMTPAPKIAVPLPRRHQRQLAAAEQTGGRAAATAGAGAARRTGRQREPRPRTPGCRSSAGRYATE